VKLNDLLQPIPDEIPAEKLALLLSRCGVRIVVINACRSASRTDQSSNIARLLVKLGIQVAIGMSYNVLSLTAERFMSAFYNYFLRANISAIQSVYLARKALRKFPERKTKFDTKINLDDHFIPVTHCIELEKASLEHLRLDEINIAIEFSPVQDTALVGRETDILQLETFLTQQRNVKIHIKGPPGVGKTALLNHASTWWKETGLYRQIIVLDVADHSFKDVSLDTLLIQISGQLDQDIDVSLQTIVTQMNSLSCLLIIDGLESAKWSSNIPESVHHQQLWTFLRRLRQCPVVVLSRSDDSFLASAINISLELKSLDLLSSVKLGITTIAANGEYRNAIVAKDDYGYLEQLVMMMGGNPLAIQVMAQDFSRHQSENPTINFKSHMMDMLEFRSTWIDEDFIKNNPGARSILQLQDFFDKKHNSVKGFERFKRLVSGTKKLPRRWSGELSELTSIPDHSSLHNSQLEGALPPTMSTYPAAQSNYDLSLMFSLANMAFWQKIPYNLEPFVTTLVALDWTKRHFQKDIHVQFRKHIRSAMQVVKLRQTPFYRALKVLKGSSDMWKGSQASLDGVEETCQLIHRLLTGDLSNFVDGPYTMLYGDDTFQHGVPYYSISPLLTLVSMSANSRRSCPSGFLENLEFARAMLYEFNYEQVGMWNSPAYLLPSAPQRKALQKDLDHDFFNHLSRHISFLKLGSWPIVGDYEAFYIIADSTINNPRRTGIVSDVLIRFIKMAIDQIMSLRLKYIRVRDGEIEYDTSQNTNYDWYTVTMLELACTSSLLQLFTIAIGIHPFAELIKHWNVLIDRPMFPHSPLPKGERDLVLKLIEANSAAFRVMKTPNDSAAIEAVIELSNQMFRERDTLLGVQPSENILTFSELIGSSLHPSSFMGKHLHILRSLENITTADAFNTSIRGLETLLLEEAEGLNSPYHRWVIHGSLSKLHKILGNLPLALEHHVLKEEIKAMLDPVLVSKIQEQLETWNKHRSRLQYSKTNKAGNETERLEARLMELHERLQLLETSTPQDERAILKCACDVAHTTNILGRVEESAEHFRRAVARGRKFFPTDDSEILEAMRAHGFLLSKLNRYDEAINKLRIVRNETKKTKGETSLEHLQAVGSLGSIICRYVQWDKRNIDLKRQEELLSEAEHCFEQAIEGFEADPSPEISEISMNKSRLGGLYMQRGEFERAEPLYIEVVSASQAITQGSYTPNKLFDAQNDLAYLWQTMKKYAESEQLHLQNLEARIERFGFRHKDTVGTVRNLHDLYEDWGKVDKSKRLLDRMVNLYSLWIDSIAQEHKEDKFHWQEAKFEMANDLLAWYQYDKAEVLLLELTEDWRETPGRERNLANALKALGDCYHNRHRNLEEKDLAARSEEFQLRCRLDGMEHFDTWRALESTTLSYIRLGRVDEAVEAELMLIEIFSKIRGPSHDTVLAEFGVLGRLYKRQGKPEAAVSALRKSYDLLKRTAPESEEFAKTASFLGELCFDLKCFPEARERQKEAATVWARILGPESKFALDNLQGSAHAALKGGEIKEAISAQQQRIDIQLGTLGIQHQDTLASMLVMAVIHEEAGHLDEAEMIFNNVWRERKDSPMQDHLGTGALSNLAHIAQERKDFDRAIQLRRQAVSLRKQLVGDNYPTTVADRMGKLVAACTAGKRWVEAEEALRDKLVWMCSDDSPKFTEGEIAECEKELAEVVAAGSK
jgi:tetratricopeptide (TPR) repeat protein